MSQELLTDDLGIGDTIDFGLDYIDLNQPDNDEAERSGSGSGINLEKISSTASQKKEFNEKLKERVPSNDAVGEHSPKIESVAVKQSNQPIQPGDGAEISGNSLQQQPQTQLQHQSDGQPPHSRSEIASQLQPQSNEQQVLQQQQQLHQDAPSNSIAKPSVFHSWKPLEPVRTDPVKALEARKRRLDRQPALKMPEIHYVGQVLDGKGIVSDSTEGSFCRFKIEYGKAWELLGGDISGQTHVAYCNTSHMERLHYNHPLDVHFAVPGLQGWGGPRIVVQSLKLDWHGRKLLNGYGYANLPLTSGSSIIEIHLWRPMGTPEQELFGFMLGDMPSLVNDDPIFESAWKDRCRLFTTSAGTVRIEIFSISRYFKEQSVNI